jgi:hypothetical protein
MGVTPPKCLGTVEMNVHFLESRAWIGSRALEGAYLHETRRTLATYTAKTGVRRHIVAPGCSVHMCYLRETELGLAACREQLPTA